MEERYIVKLGAPYFIRNCKYEIMHIYDFSNNDSRKHEKSHAPYFLSCKLEL
jgi:hypothetical protein